MRIIPQPPTDLQPSQTPTTTKTPTVSTIKLPILNKGEYDIWAMKMKHYLAHTDYPIWEVIQRGNCPVSVSTDTNGLIKVLPPKTIEEILAKERERKARTTLLMALPEDHLDYPHRALQNKGIVDSGCSRHMTGNKAYLAEYQDFNGGPVAFGGSKGYITGFRESLERDINGTEELFLLDLFILWLTKVSTDSEKLIPLGKDITAIKTMAVLESCTKHNMVAYMEKTDRKTKFHEIISFLTQSSIHYALPVSPVVSTTFVEQFWMSAKSKILNNVRYITAKVAGKPVSISEASIRSDLLFNDADGIIIR
ncbi:hypothetical protein Tco_0412547 [Tanacetum coccineum]